MKDEAADWSNVQLPETRKPMSDMLQEALIKFLNRRTSWSGSLNRVAVCLVNRAKPGFQSFPRSSRDTTAPEVATVCAPGRDLPVPPGRNNESHFYTGRDNAPFCDPKAA